MTTKKFPLQPAHPERNCWGCDKFCSAQSMMCGNGSVRTPHPVELFGDDWKSWDLDAINEQLAAGVHPPAPVDTTS